MPTIQMVPVESLIEPANPQRQETLLENMDVLRESIRTKGLEQPIGVRSLADGTYRIIWGHRRSIAVTQLGWTHVEAKVYLPGEGDDDELMGAENFHRNSTSDAEEALYYKRIFPRYPEGTIGMARELNVPQSRIERLLAVEAGDPRVFQALRDQTITVGQAHEINKFQSQGYRSHALERAVNEGLKEDMIRRWRVDLQRQRIDQEAVAPQEAWNMVKNTGIVVPQGHCEIGNHDVPLMTRKVLDICHEHYNIFLQALEYMGQCVTLQQAGYWPDFMRLLRKAEGELEHGGESVRPGDPTGGN